MKAIFTINDIKHLIIRYFKIIVGIDVDALAEENPENVDETFKVVYLNDEFEKYIPINEVVSMIRALLIHDGFDVEYINTNFGGRNVYLDKDKKRTKYIPTVLNITTVFDYKNVIDKGMQNTK